jgi:hypothetical protein
VAAGVGDLWSAHRHLGPIDVGNRLCSHRARLGDRRAAAASHMRFTLPSSLSSQTSPDPTARNKPAPAQWGRTPSESKPKPTRRWPLFGTFRTAGD